ncbi:type VI secretion system baseplate subunit TssF [Ideonella sp. A 288]|uniref:type VI secretion system baseplate subunit TssF n=1 Tax=Ideonella sp. A 288 TaxID=1962181 RepID=UPI000B4B4A71|nr:type VI secretion system baseplate subunit TssF [Ideonella sp. A 288]
MDPRLLRLYNDELTHLREVGAEFAAEFPKIASRLGMEGLEVADPYVERLLEGFAFLAARVQLKIEAEQPRLIAHLLESIYPNFLAPTPSMMVLRMGADLGDPNLAKGHRVPRGSMVQARLPRGQNTLCEFRTSQDVTIWPIEITGIQYFSYAPDLPMVRVPVAQGAKGGIRIRLRSGGGLRFSQLGLDRLTLYIGAANDTANRLHELLLGAALGTWVLHGTAGSLAEWRDADSVQACGFEDDQALLPETERAFSGHRLVQELAALPQRLLFFEITDLASRLSRVDSDTVELVVLFSRGEPSLESLVDDQSLSLHCTPAINLFRKRLDRVQLGQGNSDYHLVPDRTRPMDFEIHSIESVIGHGAGRDAQRQFRSLYDTRHAPTGSSVGYFALRREPRLPSERQRLQGARSAYIGEEVYLSLIDADHGAYREDLRQLSVQAWVTNRDLPTLLPAGTDARSGPIWRLESPGPVATVDVLKGPTRPVSRQPGGAIGWSLVSQLSMNHLALSGNSPDEAAAGLRTMLKLYGPLDDVAWARQVDGLRALIARPVVRRLPFKGPLSFGNGLDIELEIDDLAFQGASAFMFASVLERFLCRHAAVNSFTQLSLRSSQRGLVHRWPPRMGGRERL